MIWQIPRRHYSTTQYQAHSLSSLLFEDLFEAVNIQAVLCGGKEDPKPSITSLNKTNTYDGYDFNIDIINHDEYKALQKELLMLFEGFASLVFGNSLKTSFVF